MTQKIHALTDRISNETSATELIKIEIELQLSQLETDIKRPLLRLVEAQLALVNVRKLLGDAYVVCSDVTEGDLK